MYCISFRIPYNVLGQRAYINGAAWIANNNPRKQVFVGNEDNSRLFAEVVDIRQTGKQPEDFAWRIVD